MLVLFAKPLSNLFHCLGYVSICLVIFYHLFPLTFHICRFFRGKNLVFQLDNCSRTYQLYRDILIFFYDWKPYSFLHFPSKRSIDM